MHPNYETNTNPEQPITPGETPMRYEYLWRNKWLTAEATSIEEMAKFLIEAGDLLLGMAHSGATLRPDSDMAGDYAWLATDDPAVAQAFGFEERDDREDEEEDEGEGEA